MCELELTQAESDSVSDHVQAELELTQAETEDFATALSEMQERGGAACLHRMYSFCRRKLGRASLSSTTSWVGKVERLHYQ